MMDTSEVFVNMCEKAKEDLLFEIELNEGCLYFDKFTKVIQIACESCAAEGYGQTPESLQYNDRFVPLFSQDQLQDMLDKLGTGALVRDFVWWFVEYDRFENSGELYYPSDEDFNRKQFKTMEQLWLAFVMEELYNKKWDGKEWKETFVQHVIKY